MFKRTGFIRRPDGLSVADFRQRWLDHRSIAVRIPGLRGYRINFVERWMSETTEDWDGYAELWFDDEESMIRGFASLKDEIEADTARFIGTISLAVMEEHVVL